MMRLYIKKTMRVTDKAGVRFEYPGQNFVNAPEALATEWVAAGDAQYATEANEIEGDGVTPPGETKLPKKKGGK